METESSNNQGGSSRRSSNPSQPNQSNQTNQSNPNLAQINPNDPNNPNLTRNNHSNNSISDRRGQGESRARPSTSSRRPPPPNQEVIEVIEVADIPLPEGAGGENPGGPNPPPEDEPDKVIVTRQDGLKLEGDNLTEVRDGLQAKVMEDQDRGQRYLSYKEWKRTKGRLEVVPEDGPDQADGTPLTARQCGDALIQLARNFRPRLFDQDHGWRTA